MEAWSAGKEEDGLVKKKERTSSCIPAAKRTTRQGKEWPAIFAAGASPSLLFAFNYSFSC